MTMLKRLMLCGIMAGLLLTAGCGGCGKKPGPASGPAGDTAAATAVLVDPLAADRSTQGVTTDSEVEVPANSARDLYLPDGTLVEAAEGARFKVTSAGRENGRWQIALELLEGSIRLDVPPDSGKRLTVHTAVGTAGVRGTEFSVSYQSSAGAEVSVFDGTVVAANAGAEQQVTGGSAALIRPGEIVRQAIRDEIHRRWQEHRARIADRLIERYNLDIDGDQPPDLDEVMKMVPEAVRARHRQRMEQEITRRRQELRAALQAGADSLNVDARSKQERFAAARRQWVAADAEWRERVRQGAVEFHERVGAGLDALADTLARRGSDTAARRARAAADESRRRGAAAGDTLARNALVEPKLAVEVGPAEGAGTASSRQLIYAPAPPVPRSHLLNQSPQTFRFRLLIGPGGFVREATYLGGSVADADAGGRLTRLVRTWRFNADADRREERRTITVRTTPAR